MKASRRDGDGDGVGASQRAPATSRTETGESLQDCLRHLVQLLPQVTRGMRRNQIPPTARGAKLGPRHGAALSLLSENGPLTVGQLAGRLELTLPTISGIVADVEKAGFVTRAADPTDRRRTIVSLIPAQTEAVSAWLDGSSAPMVRALDKLRPDERATLLKAMSFLQAELDDRQD